MKVFFGLRHVIIPSRTPLQSLKANNYHCQSIPGFPRVQSLNLFVSKCSLFGEPKGLTWWRTCAESNRFDFQNDNHFPHTVALQLLSASEPKDPNYDSVGGVSRCPFSSSLSLSLSFLVFLTFFDFFRPFSKAFAAAWQIRQGKEPGQTRFLRPVACQRREPWYQQSLICGPPHILDPENTIKAYDWTLPSLFAAILAGTRTMRGVGITSDVSLSNGWPIHALIMLKEVYMNCNIQVHQLLIVDKYL